MPPKTKFTASDVITASLEVITNYGLDGLTARHLAAELGSSTAPVYSNFETMKDLERAAIRQARDLLLEYTSRSYTDRIFLNMGTGIVIFARDHPRLYRAIFLKRPDFADIVREFLETMRTEMVKDLRFASMPAEHRNTLLNKMWIFTHGLASLISVGLADDSSDRFIIDTLQTVGTTIIKDALTEAGGQTENGI
ncbi:MAG: TetR/AcrR family transcriptional regulator [Candidatus Zixiibacteriota bacterium]|nr:MAG: TetR/AcrR family transcriptional regulator [candidate division Zixibacteria bacterium]